MEHILFLNRLDEAQNFGLALSGPGDRPKMALFVKSIPFEK